MSSKCHLVFLLLSLASTGCAQSSTATVSPAGQASSAPGISSTLDPAFAGFGIEPSNLYSFTGGSDVICGSEAIRETK